MQAYLKSVWDDVLDDIKESIDDPDSRAALKGIMEKAMIKNAGKLPNNSSSGGGAEKANVPKGFGTKHTSTKGTVFSAYNLHWNDWKQDNTQKEFPDPEDSSKKLTQHKYWQKHIWPNLDDETKQQYDKQAKELRQKAKDAGDGKPAAKRKTSKSGFQLFIEKMKKVMDKDEEFTHPENGEDVKLHRYLLYIWSNYIKKDEQLKEPFEAMAKEIKESDDGDYDLDQLPYLDPEKLRAGDLDDLDLIED